MIHSPSIPPRLRASVTRQRARPGPSVATAEEARAAIRQRVVAARGAGAAASPGGRESNSASPPRACAASCNLRLSVRPQRPTSPSTAPSPPWRSPSSIASSTVRVSGAST